MGRGFAMIRNGWRVFVDFCKWCRFCVRLWVKECRYRLRMWWTSVIMDVAIGCM